VETNVRARRQHPRCRLAHHVQSGTDHAAALAAGVDSWPGGKKEHFIRITPVRITGRRIRRVP